MPWILLSTAARSCGSAESAATASCRRPDGARVQKRPQQPLAEGSRAHRRPGPVEGRKERAAEVPFLGVLEELERGDGGGIEHHGVARDQALETGEVAERLALRLPQIRESSARGLETRAHVAHAQAVERVHAEVRGEPLARLAQPRTTKAPRG